MNQSGDPQSEPAYGRPRLGWQLALHTVVFEADTCAGRRFDQVLIAVILISIAVVMADSIEPVNSQYARTLMWPNGC